MRLLIISLIMLFSACKSEGQIHSKGDRNIYIYEFPGKIIGQTIIGFCETKDTFALQIAYKIYYTKDRITKIKKDFDSYKYNYLKKDDGSIYIEGLKLTCFQSEGFRSKKQKPDEFYKLISPSFLNMSNKDRQIIIENLVK